jgi:ribosome-associated translation inhibitor RaiA
MTEQEDLFEFEFHSDVDTIDDNLRDRAEERLVALTKGHRDLIGASVSLEPLVRAETTFLYRARVVAFVRPRNLVGVQKADTPEGALKGALDAVERQLRAQRDALHRPWEKPSSGREREEGGEVG